MIRHTHTHIYYIVTQDSTSLALPLSSPFKLLSATAFTGATASVMFTSILSGESVKLYFICKLFSPRLYLSSAHLSFIRSFILSATLSYPGKRSLKYLCAQIRGFRARSNRSHRARERRGPINIKPPDQIVLRLKKKEKKEEREQNKNTVISATHAGCRRHFARSCTAVNRTVSR